MKLWLLLPVDGLTDNPWDPWFDKCFGFVIRAETEQAARDKAHRNAEEENKGANTKSPWLDYKYSTCEPLLSDGEEAIIMKDFRGS